MFSVGITKSTQIEDIINNWFRKQEKRIEEGEFAELIIDGLKITASHSNIHIFIFYSEYMKSFNEEFSYDPEDL